MTVGADGERSIFDFARDEAAWGSIDDRVMGGRSVSGMRIDDGMAVFEGTVSRENNGGFASVRSGAEDHDLSGFEGIALRVRGDGRPYGLRLRTDRGFDGINYQSDFPTEAGVWIEAKLPFDSFAPLYRGRSVDDSRSLDPGAIKTFGLITLGRSVGAFRLEIASIRAYRS